MRYDHAGNLLQMADCGHKLFAALKPKGFFDIFGRQPLNTLTKTMVLFIVS